MRDEEQGCGVSEWLVAQHRNVKQCYGTNSSLSECVLLGCENLVEQTVHLFRLRSSMFLQIGVVVAIKIL